MDGKMKISLSEKETGYVLQLNSNVLTVEWIFCLKNLMKTLLESKSVALDLQNVECICAEFLEFLKETSIQRKISLINLQSELFVLLNLTEYDKFTHIFLNEIDYLEQKRALINRKFTLLDCA